MRGVSTKVGNQEIWSKFLANMALMKPPNEKTKLVRKAAETMAAMCVIGRLIADEERQTRNYLKVVVRWNMVVAVLLVAVSILANDWSAFRLLLTVFGLLAIPVVSGIVTWLKHEN